MGTASAELVRESWVRGAISLFREQESQYQMYEDYYLGDHKLAFATDKWRAAFGSTFEEFADNWCQVVVDAPAQRMKIVGWKSEDKDAAKEAQILWDDRRLNIEAQDLHTQTFTKGDGYLMVWEGLEDAKDPQFYYNDALETIVFYDPANKRRVLKAAKKWIDELGQLHLRVYYRDHIESYFTPSGMSAQDAMLFASLAMASGRPMLPTGWEREQDDIDNPYRVVPVFHFRNRALGSTHGISEIKSVIPIQNAINKVLMDGMVTSEFEGFPQKAIAGAAIPKEGWKTGPNRLWVSSDPNTRFHQFDSADLRSFVDFVEMLVGHVAKTTQSPLHYLRSSGDMPSGEALKTAESGLVHKCNDRAEQWDGPWGDAMFMALQIKTGEKADRPLHPVWEDPETRHDLEQSQTAQLKALLGVPLEQLWQEHFGYTDQQIATFKKMNKASFQAAIMQFLAQSGQTPPGLEAVGQVDLKQALGQLDLPQMLALLPKSITSGTPAGEATTRPQPNSRPPASPTRRSSGFHD